MNEKMLTVILRAIVFIIGVTMFSVPLITWVLNPSLTQMEIFFDTWIWSVYGLLVLRIGDLGIRVMFDV